MSSYSQLYWLTRLDYLQGLFIAAAIVMGCLTILYFIGKAITIDKAYDAEKEADVAKYRQKFGRRAIIAQWLLTIFIICSCFVPTKNEMIVILAGGKVLEFARQDSSMQRIPGQATQVISEMLDDKIKELKEK